MKGHQDNEITYFGATDGRGRSQRFGIRQADRRFHMYAIGKTGTGKSTLIKNLVLQDIASGRGLCLLDPHGDLVEEVRNTMPVSRLADLQYLDTPNGGWTLNPLAGVSLGHEALAVAELVEVFKKIWSDDWGPRLEHLLRNVLFALLETPGSSLADAMKLVSSREYRDRVVRVLRNTEVKEFWLKEFSGYSPAFRAVVVAPLQNKLGALLTDPRLREIIAAKQSSFDLKTVMDHGKILLVNLSRGRIGEGPATLLGALIAAKVGLAGLARADRPELQRRDFSLYLDEAHMFSTESLATMLSELRKYRVSLILANQYLGQLDPAIRDAILGNVGTMICFRLSADDAELLAREMEPVFARADLVGLPNHHIYLRLMIDGQVSRPFSATTLPNID